MLLQYIYITATSIDCNSLFRSACSINLLLCKNWLSLFPSLSIQGQHKFLISLCTTQGWHSTHTHTQKKTQTNKKKPQAQSSSHSCRHTNILRPHIKEEHYKYREVSCSELRKEERKEKSILYVTIGTYTFQQLDYSCPEMVWHMLPACLSQPSWPHSSANLCPPCCSCTC